MRSNKYLLLWLIIIQFCSIGTAQNSMGFIRGNTNQALPTSYDFKEYVFAEPDDQGECNGTSNNTARIEEIFLSQTHRHSIEHPLFFTIGLRPALLQLAVTGTGPSPDVQVEGFKNGKSLGLLCLKGPATLSSTIDLNVPDFENYFSVTLPKTWIEDGLELVIKAGENSRTISSQELKIGPYTELNLVMVNMDVMDYNGAPHKWPIFDAFLEEVASAIPASVVRFGVFPETLTFPEVIANNDTEFLVRLKSRSLMEANNILSDGSINSIATLFLGNLHRSTGDYLSTVYFGNTLNLAPGGWGGGKSFVSFDFTDVFIHELGHALSLPHWGEGSYANTNVNEYEFLYPYGGTDDNGGGRGEAWNFIQSIYEFVDPQCQDINNQNLGEERSDCMQRNNACYEERLGNIGPWDGFGDFSAMAIHRYLIGADVKKGKVNDRQEWKDFQFNMQEGFPIVSMIDGKRTYKRDKLQPQTLRWEEEFDVPGEELLNQDVYLIYGTAHESQSQANIVYEPIRFKGTLPPIIDPTDPMIFSQLKGESYLPYLYDTRDILLKMTYEDGSVLHAINPFHSYQRAPYTGGYHIWRDDICNFSLIVPGDKKLLKVELFNRPFCIRWDDDDTPGNINYAPHDITAANFIDDATFQAYYEFGRAQTLGSNTIGNRVWHDKDRDGIEDPDEEGIAGVSLVLWRDADGDQIPDWMGFGGVVKTDDQGYYSFSGLGPGNYLVFVWSVDNWGPGEPLEGMTPTEIYEANPNSDVNFDNNGHPGNISWGLTDRDIVSGMITLTADGEPLDDGDREDSWFNYDPSGNMTIDFGFYKKETTVAVSEVENILEKIYPNPCQDFIIIESESYLNHTLNIINLNGQDVHKSKLSAKSTRIDIGEWPNGIYMVLLKDQYGKVEGYKRMIKAE